MKLRGNLPTSGPPAFSVVKSRERLHFRTGEAHMKVGDKVTATFYGKPVTGRVAEVDRNIVFIKRDDTGRIQWFPADSLTPTKLAMRGWVRYSTGRFTEDLSAIVSLNGSSLYEVQSIGDLNFVRRLD
mgnify:CR=1 FL=1